MSASGQTSHGQGVKKVKAVKISTVKGGRDQPKRGGPRGCGPESWLQLNGPKPVGKKKEKTAYADMFLSEVIKEEDEGLDEVEVTESMLHEIFTTNATDG